MTQKSHSQAYNLRKPKLKRHMYPIIHCSIIYNSQNMEATQMSINRRMGKEDMVYPHNGILLSYKKEKNISRQTQRLLYRVKSERENQILYINTYMWNLKKNGIDDLIYKAEIEIQMQGTNIWTPRGKKGWNDLEDCN